MKQERVGGPRRSPHTPRHFLGGLALLVLASAARADDKPEISPPDTWLPRKQATLRILDKIESTVQQITVTVGDTAQVGPLAITVSGCFVRPNDLPADATAHLTIRDSQQNAQIFDAWILKEEPGINMLEHPVFDVQLAGCA